MLRPVPLPVEGQSEISQCVQNQRQAGAFFYVQIPAAAPSTALHRPLITQPGLVSKYYDFR